MPYVHPHRVFFATFPNGKRAHRIAAAEYTHAVITRIDVLWTVESMSTSRFQALRRAQRWRSRMLTGRRDPKDYEVQVVPVTCDDLPEGCAARAKLPNGRTVKSRYWPTLGERRPRWVVAASDGTGWKAVAWPTDDLEASMALTRARQDYPGVAPLLVEVSKQESPNPSSLKGS